MFIDYFLFTVIAVTVGTYLGQALFREYPLLLERGKEVLRALRSGRN